ncbi:MAG: phospholipid/cholesterol/gamma-HCH transport system substrate-binding protein [Gammaproteobacteria bacterium]|jgi:phospholipid/cholesterol/gamma-HCH transport system substrate-binding protein
MTSKSIEVTVGLFVVVGLAALLMLAMKVSNLSDFSSDKGYVVKAHFDNIGGLKVRSPVTMAGVRVGRVSDISFDQRSFQAVVSITIRPEFAMIPRDSSASIFTAGLLGEQYVALLAGGDERFLADGVQIRLTQSAVVLEELIGQFLYSQGDKSGDSGASKF